MRRRDFLRAALGAVAGLAVGVPVLARPRSTLLDGLTGYWQLDGQLDQATTWNRRLTAAERVELYNAGDGISDFTTCVWYYPENPLQMSKIWGGK